VKHAVTPPDYKQQGAPPQHYPDAERSYSDADMKASAEHGRYLATIGHCMECHSAFERGSVNYATGLGKGGRSFGPGTGTAPNITSSKTKGIGAWSDAEIKTAITKGIAKDGHKFLPPMAIAWYAKMKDSDVNDIVAWLRTVPAID
jgi:cytochrome c2